MNNDDVIESDICEVEAKKILEIPDRVVYPSLSMKESELIWEPKE